MFDHSSEKLQQAASDAEQLIGYWPTIQANDPKIYASGLVQLFLYYPEHLVAEALDPIHGLPGLHDYPPTIAKVKAFLEPRYLAWQRVQASIAESKRPRLQRPKIPPEVLAKRSEDAKSLGELTRQFTGHLTIAEQESISRETTEGEDVG